MLNTEFGLAGSLRGRACASTRARPAQLVVSTRTFVEKFGGTFGFSIPGLPALAGAIGARDDGVATVIQLDQSQRGARASARTSASPRSAGADALVRVTAKSGDTGAVARDSRATPSPASTSFQTSVTDILGAGACTNIYLQFERRGRRRAGSSPTASRSTTRPATRSTSRPRGSRRPDG